MPPTTRAQTGSLPPSSSQQPISTTTSSSAQPHNNASQPRQRQNAKHAQIFKSANDASSLETSEPNDPLELPRFTIDLSLPPEQRYAEVCAALHDEMRGLEALFDEVVGSLAPKEGSAELRGISKATGIDIYLLVSFNVILDLLMGCSSGGAAVRDENSVSGTTGTKMVHFRTLDWGMDPLRRVLVQLDYVLEPNGEIVASSINYAGFVGVLTGVRKGLSLSLNFRGVHNGSNELLANVKYYGYLAMVVLGLRPSISSTLRSYLIPGVYGNKRDGASGETGFANLPDYGAVVQEEDANERKACAERNYRKLVRRRSKASQAGGDREVNAVSNNLLPAADDIVGMVQEHPKSNECTHFAAVMDPVAGKFAWCRYWRRPIEC